MTLIQVHFAKTFFYWKNQRQVVGASKKESEVIPENDHPPVVLHFLVDGETVDYCFIRDLSIFRQSSLIFPPLKTFDGLPTAN